MRALTTEQERLIEMAQLRHVSRLEKIVFPGILLILTAMLLPSAAPLIGMFCLGNLVRECGVVERLSKTAQNELINVVKVHQGVGMMHAFTESVSHLIGNLPVDSLDGTMWGLHGHHSKLSLRGRPVLCS